jgi:hypothetical protein
MCGGKKLIPKLSDSPRSRVLSAYLPREAETPQTLLECDTLKVWAMDLELSPNR